MQQAARESNFACQRILSGCQPGGPPRIGFVSTHRCRSGVIRRRMTPALPGKSQIYFCKGNSFRVVPQDRATTISRGAGVNFGAISDFPTAISTWPFSS